MVFIKSDIEIAREANILHINKIAEKLGIAEDNLEYYGKYKAKLDFDLIKKLENKSDGKLILVTCINPTPAGEGKTTVSIGLGDALNRLNKKTVLALREPSMGPVFGIKGGAAGGGYSQVIPMEDINLHFTGDIHAVTAANNLIAALLDNHINQGNNLNIDVRRILWKRCLDLNDRQLRFIINGLGGKINGTPREDSFEISVASEIMAILCLAKDLMDLKERLGKIILGYDYDGNFVRLKDLKSHGAITVVLKDALKPNLVQTLENNPVIIHGGPFANIAHGCNSLIATKLALKLGDYVVTEAGFGADLGAEKFLDIKCREGNLKPDAVVIVVSIRALKSHGGVKKEDFDKENFEAIDLGLNNLYKHIENITRCYKLKAIVAINKFLNDKDIELEYVKKKCEKFGVKAEISEGFEKGGAGAENLAGSLIDLLEDKKENEFKFLYERDIDIKEKIELIAKNIYGADGVNYSQKALNELENIKKFGLSNLLVCIAKTQYSLSDDAKKIGRPKGFKILINDIKVCAGAGFIVARAGNIMTMPGLPKNPAAENIDIDENGVIIGLF